MKLKMKLPVLFLIGLVAMACQQRVVHEKKAPQPKDFKIIVETSENGIKMKSLQGSAWMDLSFSINDYRHQAIDEYGMADLNALESHKDANLADFAFTITKIEDKIILKGVEGTVWTELTFTLTENKQQAFDKFGMTALN